MQHVDLQKINVPWYYVILLEQNSNKNVSTYVGSVQDMQKLGQLALKFQRHQGVITLPNLYSCCNAYLVSIPF